MLSDVYSLFSKIGDFSMFWGHFHHIQNRGISGISKPNQYFDSHSKMKNGSTFDEVSIESSEFRAFDRALNEGASYFSSRVIPILALRIRYFFGPRISKTSKLATIRRPLSVQKVVCPPKKVDSKILFLGALEIPRSLSGWEHDRTFGRTVLIFEITRLYP